jgi:polynucleotide 5'-hydroxyl-kinase GRC3/NOL9
LVTDGSSSQRHDNASIAVLDLDPGQPEFSPPGLVSLVQVAKPNLSPSFCHPGPEQGIDVIRSHAIASVSPAVDPEQYVDCALELFSCYQTKLAIKAPLIVNTPGWILGTGLEILMQLIKKMKPTEVIYMSQEGPEETVDGLKLACQDTPLVTLPSQASDYTSRTALHFREMQAMSYFHSVTTPQQTDRRWDPSPLTAQAPWRVRFKRPSPGFIGLLCYDYQPAPNLIAEVINGMMVALVVIENKAAWKDLLVEEPGSGEGEDSESGDDFMALDSPGGDMSTDGKPIPRPEVLRTPEDLPYIPNLSGQTLDPKHSRLLGLALIRGIDVSRGELQILTPIPEDSLEEVARSRADLVLVVGKFDTPSWAYTEDFYRRTSNNSNVEVAGPVEMADEDTSNDESESGRIDDVKAPREYSDSPWVELLHGSQKRSVGSKVWRVRRDLGRTGGL